MMLIKFRELGQYLGGRILPYYSGLLLRHIDEDGEIVANVPEWYRFIFKDAYDNTCENILIRKYGSMLIDEYNLLDYDTQYKSFLQYINESMLRYWDLFTQKNNPYHNVDENTLVTDTFGKIVTTHDFEAQKTKTSLAERVNEMQIAQGTVTTDDGVYPQNASVLKPTNRSNVTTNAKTDTTTTNKGGSVDTVESDPFKNTDTVEQYVNTHKVERGGNIGTTTNKTLAFEQMEYASAMKLYDMFLKEYIKFFSIGVWAI